MIGSAIIFAEMWHITRRALAMHPKYDVALMYRKIMRKLAQLYWQHRTGKPVPYSDAAYLRH